GAGRLGQFHLEPGAGGQSVGLAHGRAVDHDGALLGERGDHGPGQTEQAREACIDTHPVQPVGYGHRAGFPPWCDSFLVSSASGAASRPFEAPPSGSTPKTVRATSRIAPHTMAESATLNTGHHPTDTKSTTWPCSGPGERNRRSVRLP